MKQQQQEAIHFAKEDFYNEFQRESFFEYYNGVEDKESFVKQAAIYRALVEQQSSEKSFERVMQRLLIKGVDAFLEELEGKKRALTEKDVEQIVLRLMGERSFAFEQTASASVSLFRNAASPASGGERKKPSDRLKSI